MGFLQVSTKRMLTEKQNQSASAVFWSSLDPTLRSFRLCPDQTLEFPTTPWWCKPGRRPREESHPGRQGFGGSDCHATVAAISACCYSCHHCGDVAASTLPAAAIATAGIAATTAITSSFVSAFPNYPQGVIVVSLLLGPLAIVSLMLSRFLQGAFSRSHLLQCQPRLSGVPAGIPKGIAFVSDLLLRCTFFRFFDITSVQISARWGQDT